MKPVEKRLRDKIKWLEEDRVGICEDRKKYQEYISEKLRYFIKLTGKNEYALSSSMVEDISKLLQRVRWFYW
ncbi:hypothetical protein LCGC14_2528640 [marine sediment metagenome]|uniref:Uncharacterized protein n=1 Tax=marine sediment metagenome TaxID=412755 RepID=A0A0F9DMD7_9ZZZZ